MKILDISSGKIPWPECCCSCGGEKFSFRPHEEDVVVWTELSVTQSRRISSHVPLCDACVRRRQWWFGVAGLLMLAAFVVGKLVESATYGGVVFGGLAMASVSVFSVGIGSRPFSILGYDADLGVIRIRMRNEEVAALLLQSPDVKVSTRTTVPWAYVLALIGTLLLVFYSVLFYWRSSK
jgi:hypothetical protein